MNFGPHAAPGGVEVKIRASAPLCRRVDDGRGSGHRDGYGRGRRAEAGYTLVMFIVIIAIMSIAMGVAVQTAEFQMRREREAELIFRGEQFVEAIRLYKIKYGRYPMQLKEIFEAKPRVIRKKWKDPITDSLNWGIVFLGQEGRRLGQGGRQLLPPGAQAGDDRAGSSPIGTQTPFDDTGRTGSEEDPGGTGLPGTDAPDANRMVGPIIGVHSTSCDESIKIYEGHTTYCEWKFIYREPQQPRGGGQVTVQPPVGWHPGDTLKPTPGAPGGSTGGSGSPGGSRPPPPIQTPGRP
jgi:type II secretory pathway pseudopilin PulG